MGNSSSGIFRDPELTRMGLKYLKKHGSDMVNAIKNQLLVSVCNQQSNINKEVDVYI